MSEPNEDVSGLIAKKNELLQANAALKAQMKEQAERLAALEAASAAAEEERAKFRVISVEIDRVSGDFG